MYLKLPTVTDRHYYCYNYYRNAIGAGGFPGGTGGKEPACPCRRHKRYGFDPCVRKIPWKRKGQPTPVFSRGKSQGQRSLAGYHPQGRRESDMIEST